MIPVTLSIAGSDCSAGAGIQADLKTFSTFRTHGLTALTCVVSETAHQVESVLPLPPEFVASQIRLLLSAFPVAAIKTGMLFSRAHMVATLDALAKHPAPLVVDPVMIASTGTALIEPDAIAYYRSHFLPLATLVTPNLDEAAALLEVPAITRDGLADAARALHEQFACPVLLKGGHLRDNTATDLLVMDGGALHTFEAPFIHGVSTHGTGCTYSAAITAGLALGLALPEAVAQAKTFITRAIRETMVWTMPAGRIEALNQLPEVAKIFRD